MVKLHTLRVGQRLGLLMACTLAGIVLLMTWLLVGERNLILQERQLGVRQAVESAHSLVAHFHAQANSGKMTQEQAQESGRLRVVPVAQARQLGTGAESVLRAGICAVGLGHRLRCVRGQRGRHRLPASGHRSRRCGPAAGPADGGRLVGQPLHPA